MSNATKQSLLHRAFNGSFCAMCKLCMVTQAKATCAVAEADMACDDVMLIVCDQTKNCLTDI